MPAALPGPGSGPALPLPQRPTWQWAYVAFRLGDGATQALIALAVVLHYGLPLWALAVTTACMNLVGVPAAFLWGSVIDRSLRPRRIVMLGFAMSGLALAGLALFPPFPVYVAGAMLYTMFGVATSPAASTLALQGVAQKDWGHATSRLSRSTGLAFLAGMVVSVALGFAFAEPPFQAVFASSAAMCALAAVIAARTVPTGSAMGTGVARPFDPEVAAAGQRRFDRPVFFPGRLRHSPTWRGLRDGLRAEGLLPVGTMLTFTGSVCFFTSYPGVLSEELALPAGIVLLCQAPSHLVSPLVYPWAARHGARRGKSSSVVQGALLRLFGMPALCGGIVLLGASSVPLLIAAHGMMGLSFSLMQVNAPLLMAEGHPGGKGQGVGLYHAALGLGTLAGSLAAFLLLRAFDFWVSYEFAMAMTLVGVACLLASHHSRARRTTATAIKPSAA